MNPNEPVPPPLSDDSASAQSFGNSSDQSAASSSAVELTETFFQALFQQAADAMVVVDAAGQCVEVNLAACSMFDCTRAAWLGRSLADYFEPSFEFDCLWERFLQVGAIAGSTRLQFGAGEPVEVTYSATANFLPQRHLWVLRSVVLEQSAVVSEATPLPEDHFWATLGNHLPDIFVVYDSELRIQFINAEGARRAGMAAASILGRTDAEVFSPEVVNQYLPLLQRTRASGQLQAAEVTINLPLYGTCTFIAKYVPLLDQAGAVRQILGILYDISDRKQLEADLQAYQTKLSQILNNASASISCIQAYADGTWRYEYISAAHEIVFGFTDDEFLADPNLWTTQILEADRDAMVQALQALFTDEATVTVEYRFRRKDGQLRWIADAITSRCEATTSSWKMIAVTTDVTDRKALEAKLQRSQVWLNSILNSAIGIISSCRIYRDRTWLYEYISDGCEAIYGYPAETLLANQNLIYSLIHPADRESVLYPAMELLISESPYTIEHRVLHRDGSQRWLSNNCTSRRDEANDCWIVTSIGTDITVRKQSDFDMQQALQREQQAIHQERLIGAISQNIRQSLDLGYILTTTVEEVQQFLQVDRVVIFQFSPDWSGQVVAEAIEADTRSILGRVFGDACFQSAMLDLYQGGRVQSIDDVNAANLTPCHAEMLAELQVRAVLALPILVHQGLWGLLVVHQCNSPWRWSEVSQHLLQQLSTQLAIGIHQAELYQQTQQQAQRERLLSRVIQAIHNSLDLSTIFATATSEIGQLLQVERAEIIQYLPAEQLWLNVASFQPEPRDASALGLTIFDVDTWIADQLKQGEVVRVTDDQAVADAVNQPNIETDGAAWLHVPLQVAGRVWGSLSLNRSNGNGGWQDWEVDLAVAVVHQLAIAIQQSELYQQVQQLNTNLESQVQERTEQLQQALRLEDLLRRITDKVRDSLDEAQILQTAVRELANELQVDCCDAGFYSDDLTTLTICYEHIRDRQMRSAVGRVFLIETTNADVHAQILQGQSAQFCPVPNSPSSRGSLQALTILSCPIMDDRGVLGDMWLIRPSNKWFEELEVRVVQQVANQCAIALRQSRLYQESQTQIVELERLNHLKDDFLNTISHELRTPLSNIRMATQMLEVILTQSEALTATAASARRYFQILKEECQRETNLINDLLELTRLDARTEPLLATQVNLATLLPHVVEPFRERIHSLSLQLDYEIATDLPQITTDLSYLERILTELLTNACKYTPAEGTITVVASNASEGVQIIICNSGIEIPEAERDRIFERFYRIPSQDPWRYSGIGLGLALVKKLTECLGGAIAVESSAGQTAFSVTLPLRLDLADGNSASEM